VLIVVNSRAIETRNSPNLFIDILGFRLFYENSQRYINNVSKMNHHTQRMYFSIPFRCERSRDSVSIRRPT